MELYIDKLKIALSRNAKNTFIVCIVRISLSKASLQKSIRFIFTREKYERIRTAYKRFHT